jgi:hypothetical protein
LCRNKTYKLILSNKRISWFWKKSNKLTRNYKIIQKNFLFSKLPFGPQVSNFFTNQRLSRFFSKQKKLKFWKQIIFYKSKNPYLFNNHLKYVDFTDSNSFYYAARTFQMLWTKYRFNTFSTTPMDSSMDQMKVYADSLGEIFVKTAASRWRYLGYQASWSSWRYRLNRKLHTLYSFTTLYKYLGTLTLYALQQKIFVLKKLDFNKPYFILYWTFTKTHRLYINMRNNQDLNYNYFSLFPGFFLKFYKNRRPLKRTKLFKVLLVKFLRKLLIIGNVRSFNIVINRSPTLFTELYKLFTTPNIVPYKIPNKKNIYIDSVINNNQNIFTARKFIFSRTKFYGLFKERRRGRLKRKVARRLIKKNAILD